MIYEGRLTLLRQLDEIQFLALLRPSHMSREERVHERLEVRPPPLRQRVTDLPVFVNAFARELRADGGETLVEPFLEALDFVVFEVEVVAGAVSTWVSRSSRF